MSYLRSIIVSMEERSIDGLTKEQPSPTCNVDAHAVTGPSYQAGSYMRIALIVRAYLSEGPMDYHDAMMPLHGFIYTRVILFIIGIMGTSDHLKDNINDPMAYTLAVFGAATISVSHISSPWAIVWYLGTFTLIGIKNRWSSKLERQLIKSGPAQVQASFFTEKPSEIGDLPADQLGHLVMKLLDVLYQSLMGQIW
ncbi:uncharacterized protein N7511_011544 [Penicillium nucicola]|uniref:uncharacterized protein n=1 Tax=Penicillium nucicola TaxID=1850975 RepID=UPI0025459BF7|nr:uncharacterized protein N7511_011544 [Penicillium nucicola]KAJ5742358.1 hypothetical protein N7511_011544 [Penicillium nucicola]